MELIGLSVFINVNTSIMDEITDLERKGVSIEERKLKLKKVKLDKLQAQ